jgi:hypothetical protein
VPGEATTMKVVIQNSKDMAGVQDGGDRASIPAPGPVVEQPGRATGFDQAARPGFLFVARPAIDKRL